MSPRPRRMRMILLSCAALVAGGSAVAQQPASPPAAKPVTPAPAAQAPAAPAGQAPAAQAPAAQAPAKPPAPQAAQPAAQPLKDPVVATVNGQPIRLSDVEIAQQSLPQQYRNMPLQAVFPALLDRMIDSKLVVLDGKKNKLNEDPGFKKRMAFVEDQVLQDFWIQREIARQITPEKLQKRYEERLSSMPPEEEVHARHILVATEDEAKAIIADLKKGAAFDKLAKDKSTDKASGAEGGDLGWFKKSDMVKEFADAAFGLGKGETSPTPVKTQFGYHVIKVEDRRKAPPPPFEEMADQLREEMAREVVTGQIDQLRASAKIEKFNMEGGKPDAAPAPAKPAPGGAAPSPGK